MSGEVSGEVSGGGRADVSADAAGPVRAAADAGPGRGRGTSRRRFLQGLGLSSVAVAAAGTVDAVASVPAQAQPPAVERRSADRPRAVPFVGMHQAGIATRQQSHAHVATWRLHVASRAGLRGVLRDWTDAARRLTTGAEASGDNGDAVGLGPARLTLTLGLGPAVFGERFGLARPEPLQPLPAFGSDHLEPQWCGGDLVVQSCADDAQVSFHAIRTLAHVAADRASVHWLQSGFLSRPADGTTPRNLLGFRDGTENIRGDDPATLEAQVWIGPEGPSWLRGGSYLVVRRITMRVSAWDTAKQAEQEHVIGRRKTDGRLLPVAPRSHVALAAPATVGGARLLRRGYNFADAGPGGRLDAGLLFIAYQRDVSRQFVAIQRRLAAHDRMNEYIRHVGSGVFAVPAGLGPDGYWAQQLLDG